MALIDKVTQDNHNVFQNPNHFSREHTWNGIPFQCVDDEETALKRKNNNVVDINWDNNKRETTLYVCEGDFPGVLSPNEHGIYDGKYVKILQINRDMGMITITIATDEAKGVI